MKGRRRRGLNRSWAAGLALNPSEEEEEGLLQPPVLPEVPTYKK
jgi:hypothetical protein